MKIDRIYLKKLLSVLESALTSTINLTDIIKAGVDIDDEKFVFHMKILEDKNYLRQEDGGFGLGFVRSADGHLNYAVIPLRLTAEGHEFAESINNPIIWKALSENFPDSNLETIANVAQQLMDNENQKKINALTTANN